MILRKKTHRCARRAKCYLLDEGFSNRVAMEYFNDFGKLKRLALGVVLALFLLSSVFASSKVGERTSDPFHQQITQVHASSGSLDGPVEDQSSTAIVSTQNMGLGTFAFYYAWYGNPSVSGYWNHWNGIESAPHNPSNITNGRRDIASTDYPLLDAYDSKNETVIDQHIQWAKKAGVNCFIVSWWGINDFTDNASKHIMNACERTNFKFAFYYETTSSTNQTVTDLNYLVKTYGNSPSFYRIDNRPVVFVYYRARDNLNPQGWIWHACADSTGVDQSPNTNASASTQWVPSEEIRLPPRVGIIPFQPFKTTPGFIENEQPIFLPPNDQYLLNVSVSNIRNDSGPDSQVGIKIEIGQDPSCNETLKEEVLNFADGWQDWSFDITRYAGKNVYIKAESYATNWNSSWAALDSFYISNSASKTVNADPFFDNSWKDVVQNLRVDGANLYLIVDFGGYEGKIKSFVHYFQEYFDGFHTYNPIELLKIENIGNIFQKYFSGTFLNISNLYSDASQLAHSYNKTFIATVVPGFNNTVAIPLTVDRDNGAVYRTFWQSANASNPDGYAITSFNEWHEGTEIEPSLEYGYQYINFTPPPLSTPSTTSTQSPIQSTPTPITTPDTKCKNLQTISELILLLIPVLTLITIALVLHRKKRHRFGINHLHICQIFRGKNSRKPKRL
jgi:hypothetical protein